MVERESSQALPVLNQQLMNSWDIVKLVQSSAVEENQTSATNVQSEAESLGSTFLNADLDEITNTIYLHESENPNIFSETELSLMNQHDVDLSLTNENSHYNIIPDPYSKAHDHYMELGSPVSLWGCPMDLDVLKMDDVFQVDKADLVQSPTLAELNANDESLFDSFDSFELSSFSENKAFVNPNSVKLQTENVSSSLIISSLQNSQTDILKESSNKLSDLKVAVSYEELGKPRNMLAKCDNFKSDSEDTIKTQLKSSPCDAKLQTVPSISLDVIAKQISTKPPSLENQTKIESQHDSFKSDFKAEYKQPKTVNIKQIAQLNEDAYDSDEEDSDMDFFNSSDAESMDEQPKTSTSSLLLEKKRSRYFWQYNIQSKGPKGPRAKLCDSQNSFPKFPNIRDPVFSSHEMEGVRHAGKARRGDGNDLTPNPRKLYTIGIELQKLNSIIEDLVPVNELPFNVRTKSRKEKNKLASRACRLKKKAQHEANKLKLFGLQQEQKILLNSMRETRKLVKEAFDVNLKLNKQVIGRIKDLTSKSDFTKVAGHSADFVNSVLEKVANGDSTGGLGGLQSHVN